MGGWFGGGGGNSNPPPLPVPQAPTPEPVQDEAAKKVKKRRQELTQTKFSGPLGTSGQADIARKTLLGQ